MPCPSRDIRGPNRSNTNWNNWQRSAPTRVARYWEPISLPEIVNIVQRAEAEGRKLHVRGGGFSLNDCAAGQDWMMDLQHLNRVLDATFESDIGKAALTSTWRRRQAEGERPIVHVEAGARLFDICQRWTPLARVQQLAAARHKLFARSEEDRFYHCSLNGNRWLLSGHANGLTAMAADDDGLYGITRSNLFLRRDHSDANVNWSVDGRAPGGLIGLAVLAGFAYGVDRAGGLHRRPLSDGGWRRIGTAPGAVALAADQGRLFIATTGNDLLDRPASGRAASWRRIGHANTVDKMAATEGRLFCITGGHTLWQRPISNTEVNWQSRGRITRGDANRALPTLGGFLGQTLAGAVKTSTHGSDLRMGPLPEFVHALHIVTAGGQELWIERASRPLTGEDSALRQAISACRDLRIIRDDDAFNAAVVDVGRVGITYAMVMEARPGFGLAEFAEELPWARVSSALRRGRDRVRDVTWEEIGRASNVTAMTGSSDTLFAATSRNALWARAATDGDAQWHFVGPAEDIRAMTLAGTRLFAVTNNGLLLHRPVSGRASGWTRLGRADGVQALTAVGRWLYGTNNRSRLLRRSTVLRDERVWVDCGHANEIVSLAQLDGTLLGVTARGHIVARRHGLGDRNWDDAGPSHGVRHLATGGRRLYGVGPSKDLRVGTVVADPFDTLNALLGAPPARLALTDEANDYRYLDLVFSTRDPANCFVRRRWEVQSQPKVEDINMAGALDFYTKIGLHDDLRTGVMILAEALPGIVAGSIAVADIAVQTAPLPPDIKLIVGAITSIFAGFQAVNVTQAAADLRAVAADPEATLGAVLAVALNLLERSELERVVPQLSAAVSAFANDQVRGVTLPGSAETVGRQGLNWAVSSGTTDPARFGDLYRGESIEIIFSMRTRRWVTFLQRVLDRMMSHNQAGYVAVRFSARSDALMSMYNLDHQMGVAIEITSLTGLNDNRRWYAWLLEQALAHNGRPHWGQYVGAYGAREVARLYGPVHRRWRTILESLAGSGDTFSNAYTRRMGLEPIRRATGATVRVRP